MKKLLQELDHLFKNVGRKLKKIAKAHVIIAAIVAVIAFWGSIIIESEYYGSDGEFVIVGIVIAVITLVISVPYALLLYAIGDIHEQTNKDQTQNNDKN